MKFPVDVREANSMLADRMTPLHDRLRAHSRLLRDNVGFTLLEQRQYFAIADLCHGVASLLELSPDVEPVDKPEPFGPKPPYCESNRLGLCGRIGCEYAADYCPHGYVRSPLTANHIQRTQPNCGLNDEEIAQCACVAANV